MKKIIYILAIILIHSYALKAQDRQGPYSLSYVWLSDSTWQINSTITTNCHTDFVYLINPPFPVIPQTMNFFPLCYLNPTITNPFNIYSKEWNLVPNLLDGRPNGSVVKTMCANTPTSCNSPYNAAHTRTFRQYLFQNNITLPYKNGLWRFIRKHGPNNNDRRDVNYTNIVDSSHVYIESQLNYSDTTIKNSSALLNHPEPFVVGAGALQTCDFSATDIDGDSLVYSLIPVKTNAFICGTILTTPVTDVPYVAPYSLYNPFNTSYYNWDSINAKLHFVAVGAQFPLLNLLIDEYRNGVWVGNSMHEIAIVIMPTANPTPTQQLKPNTYSNIQYSLTDTLFVCYNKPVSFCTDLKVANTSAQLQVFSNISTKIPNANLSYTNTYSDSIQACFNWTPTITDIGIHQFKLSCKDTTCPPTGVHPTSEKNYYIKVLDTTKSVCFTTSNEDFSTMNNLQIYPNPVHSKLYVNVNFTNLHYCVKNLLGESLLKGIFSQGIELATLPNGMYFIEFSNNSNTKKVVKFYKE